MVEIDSNYEYYDEINKKLLRKVTCKAGKAFLRGLKGLAHALGPVLTFKIIAIAVVLLLFMIVYTGVFLVPRQIVQESVDSGKGKIVSIFNFGDTSVSAWVEEDDRKLQTKYVELSNSWRNGLTPFQQEQAEQYALSWAVLAAIDRVLGDPAVNPEIDSREITPQPEKHYKILKPEFTWKKSTITRTIEWKEKEGGEVKHKKKKETEEVMLLTSAHTYEANYQYEYEMGVEKRISNGKTITENKEVIKNINETGPYYQPMREILAEYGLDKQDANLEFILELAATYDEEYKNNFDSRWLDLNSSIDFSQNYFNTDGTNKDSLEHPAWPLPGHTRISSSFGYRVHPITGKYKLHTGIDLPAPYGTPIYAMADGYVRSSRNMRGYGNTVLIEHGKGIYSLYGHMSSRNAKAGQTVKAGDVIGFVGSTGWSTGNHLHFEIRNMKSGSLLYVNPLKFY